MTTMGIFAAYRMVYSCIIEAERSGSWDSLITPISRPFFLPELVVHVLVQYIACCQLHIFLYGTYIRLVRKDPGSPIHVEACKESAGVVEMLIARAQVKSNRL